MPSLRESSPPSSPTPIPTRSSRPKRPPPITPRRFNRFFDAHSSRDSQRSSSSARALHDLTSNSVNRVAGNGAVDSNAAFDDLPGLRSNKRKRSQARADSGEQKSGHNDFSVRPSPPLQSSPLKSSPLRSSPLRSSPCQRTSPQTRRTLDFRPFPEPIRRPATRNFRALEFRTTTGNFCTVPEDAHQFAPLSLPFCVASCNTNTLVAVGDEEGVVRIIESAKDSKHAFDTPYLSFKPHNNAILHLSFSSDDKYLATGSGDQTAAIIDMPTQKTIHNLAGHTSSLRQVTFQPGNDNIVATCSRDGNVALWDLRTSKCAIKIQSIVGGHAQDNTSSRATSTTAKLATPSITSLQFLSSSRPHLFLTSSDSSAQLRLWDVRGRYTHRQRTATPISTTVVPPAHIKHRQYGISSLAMSSDDARLYAVCKDSTVYAYSTNHMILGQAPELNPTSSNRLAQRGGVALGPLYGFRHSKLRTSTFYVRAAIRKASADHPEMLAVGSSEGCPILFPMDESMLRQTAAPRKRDGVPIYDSGTPLIRGHGREVTSLAWTVDGDLVTVGDDYMARCWREDANAARELRMAGEGQGRRWRSGWADVGADWDEDDG